MSDVFSGPADTEAAGYRLQLTLVDLVDLTLQIQHVRWNLPDDEGLRSQLDDFDALARAGSDTVAGRLRQLGVAPDGRIGTAFYDLLFEPLPAGPLDARGAVLAFSHRLTQLGSRIRESIQILEVSDPESLEVLAALNEEIAAWVDRFAPGS